MIHFIFQLEYLRFLFYWRNFPRFSFCSRFDRIGHLSFIFNKKSCWCVFRIKQVIKIVIVEIDCQWESSEALGIFIFRLPWCDSATSDAVGKWTCWNLLILKLYWIRISMLESLECFDTFTESEVKEGWVKLPSVRIYLPFSLVELSKCQRWNGNGS